MSKPEKEELTISTYLSKPYIGFVVVGLISILAVCFSLKVNSITYVALLSSFAFVSSVILISIIIKHKKPIKNIAKPEITISQIEKNILDALEEYKIEAIIKENDIVKSFNKSAKEKASSTEIDYSFTSLVDLSLDKSRQLAIFSPPATINPNEGEEFVLRLSVPCAIIDEKSKITHMNKLFSDYFSALKVKDEIRSIIIEGEIEKFNNTLESAEKNQSADPKKFQIKDTQKFFLLSINKITKSKEPKYLCQAVDITDFIYDESKQIQSQKMQAVGQLAGSIAHDFNNLLTVMIGFCDILLEQHGPTDPGFNEAMQIKQNANRAAELVKQLLAFSRKQVMNLSSNCVNEIIVELASLLHRLIGEEVKLDIDCRRHISNALTDKNQLEQVIINLAVNARDAMNRVGNLSIRTKELEIDKKFDENKYHAPNNFEKVKPGKYVVIEIEDTGTGISAEIIDNIFDPFFSTKDPGAGTGLGLATVYGIVKQIGGHIRFQTEKDKGTIFYIFLEATDQKRQSKAFRDKVKMDLIGDLYKKDSKERKSKVLIVEDEEPVRMFEAHALKTRGFDVVDLGDPFEAIKYLKEDGESIDIVITDVIMPGMTGPEMVEQVKGLYPNIKFLFTSGYTEEALSYFDENKDHHFLSKPFSLEVLINMIDKILHKNDE